GLGLAGALLASLGMGTAWGQNGKGGGGGAGNNCKKYCSRYSTKAEQQHCMQVCQACPNTTMLCGTSAFNLVCCSATCCSGVCTSVASDTSNCGACGHNCGPVANATTTCSGGACAYA